jgi:hypothetical protein
MRTLVPRRGDSGARTIRSHEALVHGHAVGRRAVPCTMGGELRATAQQPSGDQDQHQSAEQEPQARR